VLKRLLLVRGAEIALFAMLAALPLGVQSPYALGYENSDAVVLGENILLYAITQ
jgi:hypothetical protein